VRRRVVRTAALALVVLLVLSLGVNPRWNTQLITQHHVGLWKYLLGLPFFADALPVRISFALFPLAAYLLVGLVEQASTLRLPSGSTALRSTTVKGPVLKGTVVAVVFFALLPLAPLPIAAQQRFKTPKFITAGLWRQCVSPGRTLFVVPTADPAMQWSTSVSMQFDIVAGVFFGPDATGKVGQTPRRPTEKLLADVDGTGKVPVVTDAMRAQAAADARYWNADCAAVGLDAWHAPQDRAVLTALYGPGRIIGGVWTWSLRK